MDEQTAKYSSSLQGDLVERIEKSTKEEHMQQLEEMSKLIEEQKPTTTSYQQMEMGMEIRL